MRGEAAGSRRRTAILPLRATTAGESLDGAVALLRQRALPLLAVAAVLAAGEQVLVTRMRAAAPGLEPPFYLPDHFNFGVWWQILATGLAIEVGIITLLGAFTGAAAGPALLGRPASHGTVLRRTRVVWALLLALLLAAVAWPAAYFGLVGVVLLYALTGLVTPVLTLDRPGNPVVALGRSVRLSARGGLRVGRVRIVGYLTWLGIRGALGLGWIAVGDLLAYNFLGASWLDRAVPIAWGVANTVAYAALACLDAVLLVEARIRTEGLDIALNRSRARGEDESETLVAT
ncbi:hypothetical protein Acy02nite_85230 [Actinoplanes cyaneus]|uniref:Uncharacterized protein n=1 Tax=Actinoplanes cyaneus TaxID=52696 RepID=A0A919M996_9ACTN|nr:hypothetical protein [Actinoplanes cyaneus]MCW2143858.1 hypothetical protein [Actinoplanes cyaneus]GID70642.1 hypothetical protein Acy02nite_85230 [Actinoplanes cyaneus]